jgi:hypothetical protein
MAIYPDLLGTFNQFSDQQIIELHRILSDYISNLNLALSQRDDQIDSTPADTIAAVNDTADVQGAAAGSVRYNRATAKYQGFVPGTGWVDFH